MLNSRQESPVTASKAIPAITSLAIRYDGLYLDILRLHGLIRGVQFIIDNTPALHQATAEFAALQAIVESAGSLAHTAAREGDILNDLVGDMVAVCDCDPRKEAE